MDESRRMRRDGVSAAAGPQERYARIDRSPRPSPQPVEHGVNCLVADGPAKVEATVLEFCWVLNIGEELLRLPVAHLLGRGFGGLLHRIDRREYPPQFSWRAKQLPFEEDRYVLPLRQLLRSHRIQGGPGAEADRRF